MTREVHAVLSLAYTRPILEMLQREGGAASFRAIDVEAVGTGGSARTTSETLKKLQATGWVEHSDSRWSITDLGKDALAYALSGDELMPEDERRLREERDPETGLPGKRRRRR